MSLFEPGRKKTGGRAKGARNKLSVAFLEAFAADFEQHGAEVIKIVRVEKPSEYLKTAAYLMPKGFEITETDLWRFRTAPRRNHSMTDGDVRLSIQDWGSYDRRNPVECQRIKRMSRPASLSVTFV
jgi:hypothetical protein